MNEDDKQPEQRLYTLDEAAELLKTQGGCLRGEITVTRAGTGAVEHYTLNMTPLED